jgi:RNA polymerase sigma-70 factor, ECF subfamily
MTYLDKGAVSVVSMGLGPQFVLLADKDLISQVGQGDAQAFTMLYERHSRAAYSLAYRMMGEKQAAEDLLQEAFLKLWRGAASYRAERGSVRAWLLSIVHNSERDQVREALKTLPSEQSKALELAYFSGYTHVEIAEVHDLPLGTVKGRVRLGLKKVRDYFDSQDMAVLS